MKNVLLAILSLMVVAGYSQAFEGKLTVTYNPDVADKGTASAAEIKIKGQQVYIKQTQQANAKYAYFILNLQTKEFYTVSTSDKKIVIKYNLDRLLDFYEQNKIKAGYKKDYNLNFKVSDKTTETDGVKFSKASAETDALKVSAWLNESNIPLQQLIPLLRLLGNWNEVQGGNYFFSEATVTDKASKKESSVKVVTKKEVIAKETFDLPKDYAVKDFGKLMDENRNKNELITLIQTFTEF